MTLAHDKYIWTDVSRFLLFKTVYFFESKLHLVIEQGHLLHT